MYEDKSLYLIDDPGMIALNYFKGWIYVDVLAILPFEHMITVDTNSAVNAGGHRIIRVMRLGKLYKMLKLLRLVRVMKVLK